MRGELLPVSDYSSATFPPAAQFAAWRSLHGALFDFYPLEGLNPPAFPAEARTFLMGNLFFGWTSYPAHRFVRDAAKVSEGIDQFLVRLNVAGGHVGTNGKQRVEACAGDIDVIDMAQPMAYDAVDSTLIVLGIPRPLLEAALPDASLLHGVVVSGTRALGALLADHLLSLNARLPEITPAEADGIAAATVAMVAACLGPEHRALTTEPRAGSPICEIKAHIEQHLASRDLDADALCAAFSLSRSSLYRLFGPLGGVRRYVRDRRLVHAFVALADPAMRHRPIGEIAFEWGFVSEAHFGRVFREAFGCTPGQARDLGAVAVGNRAESDPAGALPAYMEWLTRVSVRDR